MRGIQGAICGKNTCPYILNKFCKGMEQWFGDPFPNGISPSQQQKTLSNNINLRPFSISRISVGTKFPEAGLVGTGSGQMQLTVASGTFTLTDL
jgi:hypothetical protein